MKYILIIIGMFNMVGYSSGSGVTAVHSIEFNNQISCEKVRAKIEKIENLKSFCVEKLSDI